MAIEDLIPGVPALKALFAGLAGAAITALVLVVLYEGVPLGPLRAIPFVGPALETVLDGRVDRVARRATEDLVSASELAAARAELDAERGLRAIAEDQAQTLARANQRLATVQANARTKQEDQQRELDRIRAAGSDADWTVGPDDLRRLHNN